MVGRLLGKNGCDEAHSIILTSDGNVTFDGTELIAGIDMGMEFE